MSKRAQRGSLVFAPQGLVVVVGAAVVGAAVGGAVVGAAVGGAVGAAEVGGAVSGIVVVSGTVVVVVRDGSEALPSQFFPSDGRYTAKTESVSSVPSP